MKMYKAFMATKEVVEVDVEKTTDHFVIRKEGYRESRKGRYYKYFDNERYGWIWIAKQYENMAINYKRMGDQYQKIADEITAIAKTK